MPVVEVTYGEVGSPNNKPVFIWGFVFFLNITKLITDHDIIAYLTGHRSWAATR